MSSSPYPYDRLNPPFVETTQQLTREFLKTIPKQVWETADLSDHPFDFLDPSYDQDEADGYLINQDYVVCKLIYHRIDYIMLHGFPGDNPWGLIYRNDKIMAELGEGMSVNNELEDWYLSITEEKYPAFFFAREIEE